MRADRHENIVKIVGYTPSEAADCFQALALAELLFEALLERCLLFELPVPLVEAGRRLTKPCRKGAEVGHHRLTSLHEDEEVAARIVGREIVETEGVGRQVLHPDDPRPAEKIDVIAAVNAAHLPAKLELRVGECAQEEDVFRTRDEVGHGGDLEGAIDGEGFCEGGAHPQRRRKARPPRPERADPRPCLPLAADSDKKRK